jgi:DNA-binding CsgD family transcriptional regulator
MAKPSKSDSDRARAIVAELDVLRLDQPSAITTMLGAMRELLELEAMACVTPVERTSGWGVDRFDVDNIPNQTKFRHLTLQYLQHAPRRIGWFDPVRPEPEQRNLALELGELCTAEEHKSSRGYREVLVPMGLHHHHVIRSLICDGASLLAWFGGFSPSAIDRRQRELLNTLVPTLRRRLATEQRLGAIARTTAALEASLEQLGVPAFVVGNNGRVFESNEPGKLMLQTQRSEVAQAIRAALAKKPAALEFELTRLGMSGSAEHWLAVLRTKTSSVRVTQAVARATSRFKLSPRQKDVLALVVQGESNASIAAALGVSERAVELHISAMLERAGVENRASLVSVVLLGR